MQTSSRQAGAPAVRRNAERRAQRCARERNSAFPFAIPLIFLMLLYAAPAFAQSGEQPWPSLNQFGFPQQSRGQEGGQASMLRDDGGLPSVSFASMPGMLPMMPFDSSGLVNAESCGTWTAAAVDSPTVSVARLSIPRKASHQFQKACSDFKSNKLKAAETHARQAVKIYPDYAAAWVVLGEIFEAEHRDNQAVGACRHGLTADPRYAPPYICLADFAADAKDWDETYALADRALALDPATDPYAFLYTATADFHLQRYDQAELYGLSAEKLDIWNKIPQVHLLLADVYEMERKRHEEVQELRKYVKEAPHDSNWELARAKLNELRDHLIE